MKVWIVHNREYSSGGNLGVYSTEEKARYAAGLFAADGVEEFELDSLPVHPSGCKFYEVTVKHDGTVDAPYQLEPDDPCAHPVIWPVASPPNFSISVWAQDEEHAVKAARDKWGQILAAGDWVSYDEFAKRRHAGTWPW